MNGPVVIPPGSQPCPATPNATQASIRLTFVNQTTFQADLCAEADRALGQLADLGTLVAGGFRLNVSLESLKVQGKYLYGSVGMRLQALSGDIGTEFALSLVPAGNTPLAQSFAVADVVQDAIEDLIKNSVGPTMKRLVPRPAPP